MKKNTMIFAAALLSLCLTACGTEPSTGTEDSAVTTAVTEALTTADADETTAEDTETTAAEAETADSAEEEAAETTTAAAEDSKDAADTKALEEAAVEAMKNLNTLQGWMAGGAGLEIDSADAPIRDEQSGEVKYAKITAADAPQTVAEVEELIGKTVTGELKDDLLASCANAFKEQDGALYVEILSAHGFHKFEVEDGVTLSEVTDKGFTATAKGENNLDGRGKATFVKDGGNWVIDSYEFGEF